MFHLIDEDGSGGIDFEEMYAFLASNKSKSTKFNIATCITSSDGPECQFLESIEAKSKT